VTRGRTRSALGQTAIACALWAAVAACAARAPSAAATPAEPPLHLAPVADLVPAGGLVWLVDARPRAILAEAQLIPALAVLVPERNLDAFVRTRGVDLRAMDELAIAHYEGTQLFLAREVIDPPELERAFASAVAEVQGRAVDRRPPDPRGVLTRVWGASGLTHETLVVFGREACGLALGDEAPIRAAELFAEGRLKRAAPAWKAPPLDAIAMFLGEGAIRIAAPGPFRGEVADGLGGVLGAATGAGASVKVEGDALRMNVVVTGAWGDQAVAAKVRLERAYGRLAASGLGTLVGLNRPVTPPVFRATPEMVGMEVSVDGLVFLRGLADATTANLHDILSDPPPFRSSPQTP